MSIVVRSLTNGACWPREAKPTVLLTVHITGNAQLPSASNERDYANRAGSGGPSAHDYLDRDGSGIEALDPAKWCAWSNGDVQSPNLAIATVAAAVKAGTNPNKIVYREVECVGYPGTAPVTDAQLEQLAQLVAADAKATGLPVNRTTVTTHADWNSVNRANCAFPPAVRESKLAQIIARANALVVPALATEEPMLVRKAEGWKTVPGTPYFDSVSGQTPGKQLGVLPSGVALTSIGESMDGFWRLCAISGSAGADPRWVYIRRSALVPMVTGGDVAFDQAVQTLLLSRKAPAPVVTSTDVTVTVRGVAKTLSF